jgi:hypothetical protein
VNCFQTRKEFPNFWRQRLTPPITGELVAHLEHCEPCDQAFRLFALTAPVLHSDAESVETLLRNEDHPQPAQRGRSRAAAADRAESPPTVWLALSMLVAASVLAYVAAAPPSQSLSDALSHSQAFSTISVIHGSPSSTAFDDFAR